ncbi:MAG: hypothetical protein Q9N62_07760 [Ghiorsea sp.]|nr:hypothetical protein [Ghiorsea sp.]
MQKKAFLITGFSNWGKTSLLRLLVHGNASKQFNCSASSTKNINGTNYSIQQHSNDDYNIGGLCNEVQKRINVGRPNLLIAFCPTNEPNNNSRVLLNLLNTHGYNIEIIFLEERWDGHASLNISKIKQFYSAFNITYHTIINSNDIATARSII